MGNACKKPNNSSVISPETKPQEFTVATIKNNTIVNTYSNSTKLQSKNATNPEIVEINAVVDQIVKVLHENKDKGQINSPFVRELPISENAKIYALGDLEGKIDLLYRFFVYNKLITYSDGKVVWIGGKDTYVVQCGDQIDRNPRPKQDTDIGVILFMEFMYYLSEGKVVSVLGNHELMNMDTGTIKSVKYNDGVLAQYVKNATDRTFSVSNVLTATRLKLFTRSFLTPIIQNRYIAYKIDKIIFSHAGIIAEHVDTFLKYNNLGKTNADFINFVCVSKLKQTKQTEQIHVDHRFGSQDEQKNCNTKKCQICYNLWHRQFDNLYKAKFDQKQIPTGFLSVIGHNNQILNDDKVQPISYCSNNSTDCSSFQDDVAQELTVGNDTGYLILTDVNTNYDPSNPEHDTFKFIELRKITSDKSDTSDTSDTFTVKQHTVKPEDILHNNPLCQLCLDEFKDVFRKKIIPKLYQLYNDSEHDSLNGGTTTKYRKTNEKVRIHGKTRVVYKCKNTKYIIWNREYVKLTTYTNKANKDKQNHRQAMTQKKSRNN
jgi:hypothetical protein